MHDLNCPTKSGRCNSNRTRLMHSISKPVRSAAAHGQAAAAAANGPREAWSPCPGVRARRPSCHCVAVPCFRFLRFRSEPDAHPIMRLCCPRGPRSTLVSSQVTSGAGGSLHEKLALHTACIFLLSTPFPLTQCGHGSRSATGSAASRLGFRKCT